MKVWPTHGSCQNHPGSGDQVVKKTISTLSEEERCPGGRDRTALDLPGTMENASGLFPFGTIHILEIHTADGTANSG
jgi:hypothetical protein